MTLLTLSVPAVAHAQPGSTEPGFNVSLEYSAPPACPNADAFREIVAGRLGFDPFVEGAPHHVLVVLGEGDGTLEGRIEWRDRNGTWAGDRTFPARTRDCAELTRAVGFALAVQINLLATEREEAPAGASHQATQGAPEAAPPQAPSSSKAGELEGHEQSSERVTAERSPWVFGVGAGATLAVGMSPGVMGLVGVFGSAARGPLSLELGAELSTQSVKYREEARVTANERCSGALPPASPHRSSTSAQSRKPGP